MSKLEKIEKYVAGHKEEKLVKLAQDRDQAVRLAAIAGLGKVGKDDGFNLLITAHLTHRLEHETDAEVAAAIKEAVAALHNAAE